MASAKQASDAIEAHAAIPGWCSALVVDDNDDAKTDKLDEYVLLEHLGGESFLNQSNGLTDIRGNQDRHPLLLRFSVYTKANQGIGRNFEICDEVIHHWRAKELASNVFTLSASIQRVGQDAKRFRQNVDVSGFRDELF